MTPIVEVMPRTGRGTQAETDAGKTRPLEWQAAIGKSRRVAGDLRADALARPRNELTPLMAATFVPIHAAGDGAWSWHLVAGELRDRGHEVVAVDLPADDESAGLWDYADAVADAVGERTNFVVVAHSFGGFTGPLVCSRVPASSLVMVTAMIPAPAEAPADWWGNTRHTEARRELGAMDDFATYYHDVPPELAAEAMRRERNHPSERAYREPWPLEEWPEVRTHFLLCRNDRFFPADWMRRLVQERLGITPDEMDSGHCPMLSQPVDLARRLEAYAAAGN